MKEVPTKEDVDQFLYNGRLVDKSTFRAFVYNADGEQKLANNHKEFTELLSSGLWMAEKNRIIQPNKFKQVK